MARLVVYGSSVPCPDMWRFGQWLRRYEVDGMVMLDIHRDREAMDTVMRLVGSASVPTLVIAEDDGYEPVATPKPLVGRRVRAVDRETVLSEPNPGQIEPFLERHGITVRERPEEERSGLGRLLGRIFGV